MSTKSIYTIRKDERICQGDIIEDFQYKFPQKSESGYEIKIINLPYIVILTQDCDLEWDYKGRELPEKNRNEDKFLQSILICPAFIGASLREGKHLQVLKLRYESKDSKQWKLIKQNRDTRYHFLCGDDKFKIPKLVIDFKLYYAIDREEIYTFVKQKKCQVSIKDLFRESLSQRFAYYLSRIALPDIEKVEINKNVL